MALAQDTADKATVMREPVRANSLRFRLTHNFLSNKIKLPWNIYSSHIRHIKTCCQFPFLITCLIGFHFKSYHKPPSHHLLIHSRMGREWGEKRAGRNYGSNKFFLILGTQEYATNKNAVFIPEGME